MKQITDQPISKNNNISGAMLGILFVLFGFGLVKLHYCVMPEANNIAIKAASLVFLLALGILIIVMGLYRIISVFRK